MANYLIVLEIECLMDIVIAKQIMANFSVFRQFFENRIPRGKIGLQFQAGAEGRKSVLVWPRAVAVGRFLK